MEQLVIVSIILLAVIMALLVYVLVLLSRSGGGQQIVEHMGRLREISERTERMMHEEMARSRDEAGAVARNGREEMSASLRAFGDSTMARMAEVARLQKDQLDTFAQQIGRLTESNEERFNRLRETIDNQLHLLQEDNNRKLEQMRATVDEKLHATLEQRLGESFKIVSERLEQVHKGLGEMQTLASGVGDLKKVLSNVRTRGTWGEIQLGNLLEQLLTPEQFSRNVATRPGSNERVEFAIRLPGQGDGLRQVWLPIDAKFPQEHYQRLLQAQDDGNLPLVEEISKAIEVQIRNEAKSIREKYLDPPHTTDFGIMFLPIESLYAEVLRRPGLAELLQREYRVTIAGPTTLSALMNSLQMGFRTLAIEKRSSEVWALLARVKTEFGKFGDILERTQKKLGEASRTIEEAATRSRQIQHKLRDVQQLPATKTDNLLGPPDPETLPFE
jgi:DNA recombination protein RmuC